MQGICSGSVVSIKYVVFIKIHDVAGLLKAKVVKTRKWIGCS